MIIFDWLPMVPKWYTPSVLSPSHTNILPIHQIHRNSAEKLMMTVWKFTFIWLFQCPFNTGSKYGDSISPYDRRIITSVATCFCVKALEWYFLVLKKRWKWSKRLVVSRVEITPPFSPRTCEYLKGFWVQALSKENGSDLGGGFTLKFGEDFQFDEHIFEMGWFNCQPDDLCYNFHQLSNFGLHFGWFEVITCCTRHRYLWSVITYSKYCTRCPACCSQLAILPEYTNSTMKLDKSPTRKEHDYINKQLIFCDIPPKNIIDPDIGVGF